MSDKPEFSLAELQAEFLRHEIREDGIYWVRVERIEEAQGVRFLCPKCYAKNDGSVGTHSVICWSRERGTPEDATPGPGRWKLVGTGLHDLTLNGDPKPPAEGGTRSVLLTGRCWLAEGGDGWHGFVTNGRANCV